MPRYTLLDTTTDEEMEVDIPLKKLEKILKENTNLQQVFKMNLSYSAAFKLPISEDFRSLLKKIKKDSPGSRMDIP